MAAAHLPSASSITPERRKKRKELTDKMPVTISYPPGFGAIPLDDTHEERARRAAITLKPVPPGQLPHREKAISSLVELGGRLRTAGVSLAGQLTLPKYPSEVSATVLVSIQKIPSAESGFVPVGEQDAAVDAILDVFFADEAAAHAEKHQFPAGPGIVVQRAGRFEFPGSITRTGQPAELGVRSIQFLLPLETGAQMLLLDVSTPHLEHWDDFAELAWGMANSITIDSQ